MPTPDVFARSVWSALVNESLLGASVYLQCANQNYQADSNDANVVKIYTPDAVTVSDYTGTITYVDADGTTVDLALDQKADWNVQVDDLSAVQTNINLMTEFTRDAGRRVARKIDAYIASLYDGAGVTLGASTALEINSTNVLDALIVPIVDALDNAGADPDNRWIVVPPAIRSKLVLAKLVLPSDAAAQAVGAGQAGNVMGLNVLMSNQVPKSTNTYHIMAGSMEAITMAYREVVVETVRRDGSFKTAVRGLYNYGALVLNSGALVAAATNVAAE